MAVLLAGFWLRRSYSVGFAVWGLFVVLLYGGSRDFAYIGTNIGGVGVFISEIVMVIMGLILLREVVVRPWTTQGVCPNLLILYFVLGAIGLLRGFPDYGVRALRDSALCYYAVAYVVTMFLVRTEEEWKSLMSLCIVGWVLAGGVVVTNFLAGEGAYIELNDVVRYGAGSQAISMASAVGAGVMALVADIDRRYRVILILLGTGGLVIGWFLIQHRSLVITMAITSLGVALAISKGKRTTFLISGALVTLVLGDVLLVATLGSRSDSLVAKTLARVGTTASPQDDANGEWRLEMWRHGISYGMAHPLLGAGFGPAYLGGIESATDRIDPHNSYVGIMYRLGALGILCFLGMWIPILKGAYESCRRDHAKIGHVGLALAGHLGVAGFAFFNVALEGPYMGIPFWVTLALLTRATEGYVATPKESEIAGGDGGAEWCRNVGGWDESGRARRGN